MKLKNPPIVEAVLDIDCDMPLALNMSDLEQAARSSFRAKYPKFCKIVMQQHRIEQKPEPKLEVQAQVSSQQSLEGFRFQTEDERQLVQVRAHGFAFNRLAPYSTLDEYIPEMERTWKLFVELTSPVQIRAIKLRYINRILLPAPAGQIKDLQEYLKICPRLPDESRLHFVGFLNQHLAVEVATGNHVNIVLAAQPLENEKLPVILDITAFSAITSDINNWDEILVKIQSLRSLKNNVFHNTITEQCLNLYR